MTADGIRREADHRNTYRSPGPLPPRPKSSACAGRSRPPARRRSAGRSVRHLVHDDDILMEDSNRVLTENDVRPHPELNLARLAVRDLEPAVRHETTMYASTEPCSMWASGMRYASFAHVVYTTSGPEIAGSTGKGCPSERNSRRGDGSRGSAPSRRGGRTPRVVRVVRHRSDSNRPIN